MILRIQRPKEPGGPLLIYNQDASIYVFRPATPTLVAHMGDKRIIFVEATLRPGDLHIQRVLPDQEW